MKPQVPVVAVKHQSDLELFYKKSLHLAEDIYSKQDQLEEVLLKYETSTTVEDELTKSIDTLRNFKSEFSGIEKPLENLIISTFFPLNLPLYSFILFGIAPSAFANNVFIRPPEIMNGTLDKLWAILDVKKHFPEILLRPTPRKIFVDLYAKDSDVLIFTGKYENAIAVSKSCPDALMVYNGSGVNPFIVFANGNIPASVEKAVEMRCFNSGQDCAGPDIFFVQQSIADSFVSLLEDKISSLIVGDTRNPDTDIGPVMKNSYVREIHSWVVGHKKNLVYGGIVDLEKSYVYPTIVVKNLADHNVEENYHEFFAPVFYILVFENESELKKAISTQSFKQRGMYISVFGHSPGVEKALSSVRILKNKIVNDVERGNLEYGGFGSKANFLLYKGRKTVKPILVSRDIHEVLNH